MIQKVEAPKGNSETEAGAPRGRAKIARPKRNAEEVLERILDAAMAAFTRDGFKGARLRSIASEAGVTIQLLVYHVKSKEKLWELVMERMLRRYESFRAQAPATSAPLTAADRLRRLISDLVHFAADQPQLHRIMTHEGAQPSPRLVWLTETFVRPGYDEFVALAQAAQQEGAIRRDLQPERLRYAVVAIASVPFSVAAEYEYLTGKSPFSHGEIARTVELIHHMVFQD